MARDEELPADDHDIERLLRETRFGPPDPDEATPWDFVLRWSESDLRARVWPIISRLLVDDDDLVRERALEFIANWRKGADLTSPRLIDAAERDLNRFQYQAPAGVALREKLARALANRAARADGARIAAILGKLTAQKPVGGGAATVLGKFEPGFVIAQAARWGDGALPWIDEAARSLALFRRDEVIPFLQAVAGLSQESRQQLLATVEGSLNRDDAGARALAQSQGLPAPSRPAPTADECRRAIRL